MCVYEKQESVQSSPIMFEKSCYFMNVHAYICANTHKRVLNSKHKRAPAFVRGGGQF